MSQQAQSTEFVHRSVLAEEAPEALVTRLDGVYVDGTFGRGGHTRRILQALGPEATLYAFDRDPTAVEEAKKIDDPRFHMIHAPFSEMTLRLAEVGVTKVDGILLDIGVSSPQIDDASRGFSFMKDGPLDMRMDTSTGVTAAEWVNEAPEAEIARVLKVYGQEKAARPIARAIVKARTQQPLTRTGELARLIADVVPRSKADAGQHPATRSFQAIRIEINGELRELESVLDQATHLVAPDGRLVVISFHSLEDRCVKQYFESLAHPERAIDARIALRADQLPEPFWTGVERVKPSLAECEGNPRARSAVMRYATRTQRVGDGV